MDGMGSVPLPRWAAATAGNRKQNKIAALERFIRNFLLKIKFVRLNAVR